MLANLKFSARKAVNSPTLMLIRNTFRFNAARRDLKQKVGGQNIVIKFRQLSLLRCLLSKYLLFSL